MKKAYLFLLCVLVLIQGCSAIMAGKKQTRKDLSVIRVGGNRDDIVHVLGAPYMSTRTDDGGCKDIYKLVENAGTKETKTLAIVGHTTMDVVTLGLWEIVGTPLEIATQEEATVFILYYDANYKLKHYEAVK
ncbi:MAG: hypothetical protein JXA82_15430 [Sedimentisphaerales bacterium]|nr:hypothetical protein [Sedimentisphaerales bacterium]